MHAKTGECPMDLNQEELQELQEKLILIYKFIKQEKMYEAFFFGGNEFERPFRYKNKLINKLLKLEDADEFLKTCIIELEELKEGKSEEEISLMDILEELDLETLYAKYDIKDLYDVDKLDITSLMKFC